MARITLYPRPGFTPKAGIIEVETERADWPEFGTPERDVGNFDGIGQLRVDGYDVSNLDARVVYRVPKKKE